MLGTTYCARWWWMTTAVITTPRQDILAGRGDSWPPRFGTACLLYCQEPLM